MAISLGTAALGQTVQSGSVNQNTADLADTALQISSPHDRGLHEDQLGTRSQSIPQIPQVAKPVRTAQGPDAISTVSEGRTTSVTRLEGSDRCDAAIPAKKRTKDCANILENRASEFQRPDPRALSPEQRLLLTREIQGAGDDVVDASRRLARSGQADDSVESMGVASVVLDGNNPVPTPEKPKDVTIDPQTQAIINAAVPEH